MLAQGHDGSRQQLHAFDLAPQPRPLRLTEPPSSFFRGGQRDHCRPAPLGAPFGQLLDLRDQLLQVNAKVVAQEFRGLMPRQRLLSEKPGGRGAELGFPPLLSADRVSARVPTQEQYQALKLPSDLPVLRTLRVVYTASDHPIEATVMVKAGHLYELQYEFTAG